MKKRLVAILVLLLLIIMFSSLYFVITNKQGKNIEVKPDPNHHQKVEIKVPEKDLEVFFNTFLIVTIKV